MHVLLVRVHVLLVRVYVLLVRENMFTYFIPCLLYYVSRG